MRPGLEELARRGITQKLTKSQIELLSASSIAGTVELNVCEMPGVPDALLGALDPDSLTPTCRPDDTSEN
jgi:hypothetical protein